VRVSTATAPTAKSKRAALQRSGTDRRLLLARERERMPGPVELCAERNFFMRPWCIQRRCEEARFRGNAQCVGLRPTASRYAHY
jgi:hypothetical protein